MPDAERLKQRILIRKLGTEEDLKPRRLTIDDWREMNPELQEWHILTNSKNVDAMLNSEAVAKEQAKQNEVNARAWDAKRFHERSLSRTLSTEEKVAAREQAQLFSSRYPQFVTSHENSNAVMDWLGERNLPFEFQYIVQAFTDLTKAGRLLICPKVIGVGPEPEISGDSLRGHRKLDLLLQPIPTEKERREKEIDAMSADQYQTVLESTERPNPWRDRATAKVGLTFQHFHPEFIPTDENKMKLLEVVERIGCGFTIQSLEAAFATVKSELELSDVVEAYHGHKVIDYGPQSNGVPPQPEKASFRKKVANMSAQQLADECNVDPAFREALNALD